MAIGQSMPPIYAPQIIEDRPCSDNFQIISTPLCSTSENSDRKRKTAPQEAKVPIFLPGLPRTWRRASPPEPADLLTGDGAAAASLRPRSLPRMVDEVSLVPCGRCSPSRPPESFSWTDLNIWTFLVTFDCLWAFSKPLVFAPALLSCMYATGILFSDSNLEN